MKENAKWTHQNVEYTILGYTDSSFEKCYSNVLKTLGNKFTQLSELKEKEIYAFSYFYDRLNSAKVLNGKHYRALCVFNLHILPMF